jgi:hypothetical protein
VWRLASNDLNRARDVLKSTKVKAEEQDLHVSKDMSCNFRCLVLTTPDTSKAHPMEIFQLPTTWFIDEELIDKEGRKYAMLMKYTRSWRDLVYSYLVFDEADSSRCNTPPGNQPFSHLFILTRQNEDIRLVPVSGTLVTSGIQDLAIFLECFMRIGNTAEI